MIAIFINQELETPSHGVLVPRIVFKIPYSWSKMYLKMMLIATIVLAVLGIVIKTVNNSDYYNLVQGIKHNISQQKDEQKQEQDNKNCKEGCNNGSWTEAQCGQAGYSRDRRKDFPAPAHQDPPDHPEG